MEDSINILKIVDKEVINHKIDLSNFDNLFSPNLVAICLIVSYLFEGVVFTFNGLT